MRAPLAAVLLAAAMAGGAEPAERVLGRPSGPPVTVRWEADEGRRRLAVGGGEFALILPDDRVLTAADFRGEELAGVLAYGWPEDARRPAGAPEDVRVTAAPRILTATFREEPRLAAVATEWLEVRARARLLADKAVVVDERWLLVLPRGATARLRPADGGATHVAVLAPWTARKRADGRWEARAEGARLLACDEGETPEAALRALSAAPVPSSLPPSDAPPGVPR